MKTVSLTIDGKKIVARDGQKVLWAALDNGIFIPNLCAIRKAAEPFAGCRLCFVEIEGRNGPVTSCTEPVAEGMVVNTQGAKAKRLARTALELLLASHPVDCSHCAKNRSCELQKLCSFLGVKIDSKRFRKLVHHWPIDTSCPTFTYDPNKCVLCSRCVWVCRERFGVGVLGFAHRGFDRVVTTFEDKPIAESGCHVCDECIEVCPVGALVFKDSEKGSATCADKKTKITTR
jgi:formate dehydrogenase major subunit/NADH-quinone oxidoreductase subunit G